MSEKQRLERYHFLADGSLFVSKIAVSQEEAERQLERDLSTEDLVYMRTSQLTDPYYKRPEGSKAPKEVNVYTSGSKVGKTQLEKPKSAAESVAKTIHHDVGADTL